MKKVKLLILSIAGIALLMNSCKRNEDFNPLSSSSQFVRKSLIIGDSVTQDSCANYNFLKFRDKEAFINTLSFLSDNSMTSDSIFDDFEANFSQTTLRDIIEQTITNDSIKRQTYLTLSKVLATVISNDSIIQIDSLAFLLDFNNGKIYEMYPVTCSNLGLLKQKQEINEDSIYIFEYDMGAPVFHPSGYEEYSGKVFRWLKKIFSGCDEIWADGDGDSRDILYSVWGSFSQYRYFASHNYNKYGIYFEITHNWQHYKDGIAYAVPVAYSHQDSWKQFCGGWGSNSNWPNSIYGNNADFRFRTYKSTNSLARNKNLVKSYLWFQLPGAPVSPMTNPMPISLNDLNF